jgi:hypothetical protein
MAGLKPKDQKKWDSLQDQGQSHIDKILSGKSTEADLSALSAILNEQHELAGQIFDQGVEDAVQTTNAIVRKIDEERQAQGKKPLSEKAQDRLFEKTFKDVMASAIEDILGQVHDEFENQSKEIRNKVTEALERIRNLPQERVERAPAPGEVAATPEQRSLMERFIQAHGQAPESGTERRSLMDRMLRRRTTEDQQRRTMIQVIKDAATTAKDKVSALYDRIRGRNNDDDEDKKAGIWMRRLKSIFEPFKKGLSKAKAGGGKLANIIKLLGGPLLAALMNPKLIESITDAVSQYLNFDQISKYVDNMWTEAKKMGSDALDAVVEKVKAFFGGGDKKKATVPKPETKVDPLKQNTQTGPLPKEITPAEAKADLPRRESQLEAAKVSLERAKAAYKSNPTPANKKAVEDAQNTVNMLTLKVTQFKQRAGEQKTEAVAPTTAAEVPASATVPAQTTPAEVSKAEAQAAVSGAAPGEIAKPSPSTSPSAADNAVQTAPISPSQVLSNSSAAPRTEVIGDMPKYVPGKAIEPRQAEEAQTADQSKGGAALAQIGMGSFGFDSNDSAMNILNLGMLT